MMRLPRFRYYAPTTLAEATRLLADLGPEALPVAGGTDLYPKMKRRQFTPRSLVGLSRVGELRRREGSPESGLRLGAGLRLHEIRDDETIRRAYPALASTAGQVASPLIQNTATIGGNLLVDTRCNYYDQTYEWRRSIDFCLKKDGRICWVAPSSPKCWAASSTDGAPLLMAMGARVRLVSVSGERTIPVSDLYRDDGARPIDKRPEEILAEILLPPVDGWRAAYLKLRRRGSIDFPVLGVGVWVRFGPENVVEDARIVLGAVLPAPTLVPEAADAVRGRPLSMSTAAAAAEACYVRGKPLDNTDFQMTWRKEMIRKLVLRALLLTRADR